LFLPRVTVLPALRVEGDAVMLCRCARGLLFALIVSFATMLPASARAELGGDLTSVERDRVRMNASISVRPMGRYSVHEMTSDSGSTVREFASSDGKVFAVAWQGPFHPDYKQLLGPYFAQLQQSSGQQRRPRGAPVTIETPGFVFQSFGHFRDLAGRAYVPQMLPAGVGMEEIR
jgi:hypothetical protein